MSSVPLRLDGVAPAIVGLVQVSMAEANALLVEWEHYLGPCARPFRSEVWALDLRGTPLAVAISSSIVSPRVCEFGTAEVVELARLAAVERWATRVMLRLWREVCAPAWSSPQPRSGEPPLAAVAYSQNSRHEGAIYRFDGWELVKDDAGSSGGGSWSQARQAGDRHHGKKRCWLWRYA